MSKLNPDTKMNAFSPTPRQLEYQSWEFGIFIHFGIRTFFEGHKDFDGLEMDPMKFNPTDLSCEQWAETAVSAGAKYMVFTAKHHDGFANWPSRFTNYSVANSSWRNGDGDVVKEFVDACRKFDLKVGIYYSPADLDCPFYDDAEKYDQYFIDQIGELLGGRYGEIDLLWLDGCNNRQHAYNWKLISERIREMQRNILIHNLGDPDYRWCGNEEGIGPMPAFNVIDQSVVDRLSTNCCNLKNWLPIECPCRIREKNWFYSDHDEHTLKSLEELMGIHTCTIGRGCNLLLNVAPDRRGRFPEADTNRLVEFGVATRERFASPLVELAQAEKTSENEWSFKFSERTLINQMMVMEDLTRGESVKSFQVEVNYPGKATTWPIYKGENVGNKAICPLPSVACDHFIFRVTESDGPVVLKELSLYKI